VANCSSGKITFGKMECFKPKKHYRDSKNHEMVLIKQKVHDFKTQTAQAREQKLDPALALKFMGQEKIDMLTKKSIIDPELQNLNG
jgi:hypothetical protein